MNRADPLAPSGTELTGIRRILLRIGVAGVLALALVQAGMLFLANAPEFPVAQKRSETVQTWMKPLFPQDWKLFAPNPPRANAHLEVRLAAAAGQDEWIDLTAAAMNRYRHTLSPSKEDSQVLFKALMRYMMQPGAKDGSARASLPGRYLHNVTVDMLQDLGHDPGRGFSMRVKETSIQVPGATYPATPTYRDYGFWEVSS
ncbi:hypothetical protein G5C51_19045 [Streptomyces sp. A7024]|uniref:Uncharacterized protein n=1 Tax=Streptomyces coryli TaxID=1128680 RepID=A0A6G4U436_9ACTN|nr:DUF5819 family protein [Streptomyces coryli]NGN65981.1 hypothetical protein [Streptomyces coryli]